ncbi:MAG: ABC transporter substrate-binding protein [Deltaproteobacteria bacterium]|nr:ABC transporter substrate-binding protein [Deltaproteobacteria bacterium]
MQILLAVLALLPASALEQPNTAKSVVETIIERVRHLDDKATHSDSAHIIEGLVDFKTLATNALGNRASSASGAQKHEIEELLRKIITKTIYPEAPKFFRDVKIDFTAEENAADLRAHVTSVITKAEKRSTVEYWLAKEASGYRVVDLAIEGERWVENVHDQFDEIIGKKGVAGLIAKMNKRLNELDSKPARKN